MAVKKDKSIASKGTMNLAIREKNLAKSILVIPMVAAVLLLAALVGKFGVVDRLTQVSAARREVEDINAQATAMLAACADYDEVREEYDRYTYKDFDRTLADRMDVLALIEREIFPVCQVQRLALAERRLDLALEGLTLENTSDLINRLNADEMVEYVRVSTATTTEEDGTVRRSTEMTITLADATGEGEAE